MFISCDMNFAFKRIWMVLMVLSCDLDLHHKRTLLSAIPKCRTVRRLPWVSAHSITCSLNDVVQEDLCILNSKWSLDNNTSKHPLFILLMCDHLLQTSCRGGALLCLYRLACVWLWLNGIVWHFNPNYSCRKPNITDIILNIVDSRSLYSFKYTRKLMALCFLLASHISSVFA